MTKERTRSRWTPKMAAASVASDLREALHDMRVAGPYSVTIGGVLVGYQIRVEPKTNASARDLLGAIFRGGAFVTVSTNFDVSMQNHGDASLGARIRQIVGDIQ